MGEPDIMEIPDSIGELTTKPQCEFEVNPPIGFLEYLIKHTELINFPATDEEWEKRVKRNKTREKRKNLQKGDSDTKVKAHEEIKKYKDAQQNPQDKKIEKGIKGKWWQFEGMTRVDCALFTESAMIFIEGKYTEKDESQDITWYKGRNQILRNLDCAAEYSRNRGIKHFFVLMIVENEEQIKKSSRIMKSDIIKRSLPHYDEEERNELLKHYLGTTIWGKLRDEFNISPDYC